MKVKGISWLGIGTNAYADSLRFFTEVLGLEPTVTVEDQAILKVGDNQLLELFGREGRGKGLTLAAPVPAFEVDDLAAARAELVARGVELVGEPGSWDGFEWQYFRSPDKHLLAIQKRPAG